MTPTPEQARRDLAHWNATRHAWDRFQASNRRIAERIARTAGTTPAAPRYEVRTIEADPTSGPLDYWKNPPEPVHYVYDNDRERPVFGSYFNKVDAEADCAARNASRHGDPQ